MNDSILDSIKKTQGILPAYTSFDEELILYINTVFSILTQIGVGPSDGFSITGNTETWSDYLSAESWPEYSEFSGKIEMVKEYVALRVGTMFDQTKTGAVLDAAKKIADELEWRLNVAVE